MEELSSLSLLVRDFANGQGRFKGMEIGKRQKRGYTKHKIVPFSFIEYIRKQGLSDVVRNFMDKPRYQRTVDALEYCIEEQALNAAFSNAMGKMLGNFRYKINDSRASPETILADMVDKLQY